MPFNGDQTAFRLYKVARRVCVCVYFYEVLFWMARINKSWKQEFNLHFICLNEKHEHQHDAPLMYYFVDSELQNSIVKPTLVVSLIEWPFLDSQLIERNQLIDRRRALNWWEQCLAMITMAMLSARARRYIFICLFSHNDLWCCEWMPLFFFLFLLYLFAVRFFPSAIQFLCELFNDDVD